MRWAGLALVIALMLMGLFAYLGAPWLSGVAPEQLTRLTLLLMALMLVAGAGFGFRRLRFDRGRALAGALFWLAALLAAAGLYTLFN